MQQCGVRVPKSGQARGPDEDVASSDGLVHQPARAERQAVPGSDPGMSGGDEQPRPATTTAFRDHQPTCAVGEALVSESEEEVGGPRRRTRLVRATARQPRTPAEEQRLKDRFCELFLRHDPLRLCKGERSPRSTVVSIWLLSVTT